MDTWDVYRMAKKLVKNALKELHSAGEKLEERTAPDTPLPRPKVFRITPRCTYPYVRQRGKVTWTALLADEDVIKLETADERDYAAEWICSDAGRKPRDMLKALRRIQAATAWCHARAAGRQRAAQEIVKQQLKAILAIKAEAAAVRKGGSK